MTTVFSHGRLRLYLLKLLDDGPKHGYELMRLLENRFLGHYTPSAGTIYPRLQRMETEGLVTHAAAGGRKIYRITEAGQAELRQRADEVADLEADIQASVADLAALGSQIQTGVHGSVRDLKRELSEVARQTRRIRWEPSHRMSAEAPPYVPADPAAEFDRRLTAFVEEVRMLVRRANLSDAQLRTAARVLDGALDGLRRLLR
ncbi:MAG TPA: PadR family transcriptional regulator [Micromonospora sp.]|nr:PadR family transcriptional regulator [Micromonospora sp.]